MKTETAVFSLTVVAMAATLATLMRHAVEATPSAALLTRDAGAVAAAHASNPRAMGQQHSSEGARDTAAVDAGSAGETISAFELPPVAY